MGWREKGRWSYIAWFPTQQGQMGGKPGRQVLGIKSRRWGVVWGFVCHARGFRRLEKKLHGQSQRLSEQDR